MTAAPWRARARAMSVPLVLAVAVGVLVAAGRGPLAPPRWGDVGPWIEARGPAVAAAALVRLVAVGAAAWLLVTSTVRALAAAAGAVRVAALAEAAMPPAVRRVCAGLAGAGVAGAALVGVADPPRPGEAALAATVRMEVVGGGGVEVPDTTPPVAGDPAVPSGSTVSMSVAETPPPPEPAAAAPVAPDGPVEASAPVEAWVVEPGDSFWSIAEEVVADRLGRRPVDAEVAGYWSRLVAANTDRLVSGDADLIYPGQQLLLPG